MPKQRSRRRVSNAARTGSHKNRQQMLLFGGLAVAAILAVVAAVVFVGGGGGTARASDFSFSLYQGVSELGGLREMNLSRLHGKPIVLNFWAGNCPPCRAEMPQFQLFYDEFRDDITLLGIDIGPFTGLGSHRDAENLLRELGITYPAGFTDDAGVPRKYRVTSMPTTVFIKSDGEIFERRSGALNRNTLVRLTSAMLAEEAAANTATELRPNP